MSLNKKRPILMEVALMRPMLILCIVVGHSFAIFSGAWPWPFKDIELESSIYDLVNPLFISFQLAGFVFISGYVDSYINCIKNIKPQLVKTLTKKIKRLLIPAWIFGVVYYILFLYDIDTFTIKSSLLKILLGAGHLWFLPMLFGCILLVQICKSCRIKPIYIFVSLFLVGILPFQFITYTQFLHYAFYFYFGQVIWQHRFNINLKNKAVLGLNLIVYVLTFVLYNSKKADMIHYWDLFVSYKDWTSLMFLVSIDFIKMMMCTSGILFLLGAILWIISTINIQENKVINFSNRICYGVYIYHQFILWYLVYHTNFINTIGLYELPFVFFLITLVISVLLAQMSLKTKFGRFLIG